MCVWKKMCMCEDNDVKLLACNNIVNWKDNFVSSFNLMVYFGGFEFGMEVVTIPIYLASSILCFSIFSTIC